MPGSLLFTRKSSKCEGRRYRALLRVLLPSLLPPISVTLSCSYMEWSEGSEGSSGERVFQNYNIEISTAKITYLRMHMTTIVNWLVDLAEYEEIGDTHVRSCKCMRCIQSQTYKYETSPAKSLLRSYLLRFILRTPSVPEHISRYQIYSII